MKKRIIAGVAALLMVASSVPAGTQFNFSPVSTITASAAAKFSKSTEVDGFTIALYEDTKDSSNNYITVTADTIKTLGLDSSLTTLTIEFSDAVNAQIRSYKGGQDMPVKLNVPLDGDLKATTNLAHIVFGDGEVNTICDKFAQNCANLQTVGFGNSITSIGKNAFDGCKILQGSSEGADTLDLSNIVDIGDNAFKGCAQLSNIKFGDDLSDIGKAAFIDGKGITKIEFPANLKNIKDNAFKGCSNLKSVYFASNDDLDLLGSGAFENCTSLETVKVEGKEGNNVPFCIRSSEDGEDASIMYGGKNTFKGCTSLQSFNWSAAWVPVSCFEGCTSLNRVTFDSFEYKGQPTPSGTIFNGCEVINGKAFANCSKLESIEFDDATYYVGKQAFVNCTMLKDVQVSNVLSIVEEEAFGACWTLSLYPEGTAKVQNKVILPDSWKTIAKGTFKRCYGITAVDISPVEEINKEAFMECTSLKEIDIPDAVTVIDESVFEECTALKDVEISKDLTTIQKRAFFGCSALETMTPSDGTKIAATIQFPVNMGGAHESSFEGCKAFKYLNFAEGSNFAVVGQKAFKDCTSLRGSNMGGNANDTIMMPSKVVDIQASAFYGDTSLENITFSGNVNTISASAFEKCSALKEVTVNDTITRIESAAFKGCSSLKKMPHNDKGQPAFSQIELLYPSTFEDCTALTEAFIPKNVQQVQSKAFKGCKALKNVQWESGSVMTDIGAEAFANCEKLALISSSTSGSVSTFPDNVKKIGASAFAKTALKEIKLKAPSDGDVLYLDKGTFADNKEITKADISETNISVIPESCFSGCENLKTMVLNESLSEIGKSAFKNCYYLHTLGVKGCADGEYTIPDKLTAIDGTAFENNYCMQVINFSEYNTDLSLSMFNIFIKESELEEKGYTPLEAVNVDKDNPNYTSIDGVLYNKDVTALLYRPIRMKGESFKVPESVTQIGSSSMAANFFLKHVTIGKNVKTMGDSVFNDTHNLETVDFGSNDTVVFGKNIFSRPHGNSSSSNTVTLYGTTGSTAEKYAEDNAKSKNPKIVFVDNAKTAAKLTITDEKGAKPTKLELKYKKNGKYTLGCEQLTASGGKASDTLKWSTSDTSIATIDDSGVLTMKKEGTVTVTVENATGTAKASITVVIGANGQTTTNPGDGGEKGSGDVDGNGKIDTADVIKLASHVKGLSTLKEAEQARADVNGDGKIDSADVVALAAHVKGL